MTDRITLRSSFCRTGSLTTIAMAMLAIPAAIQAQAYNGTPVVTQGTVDIDRTNPGQDIFTLETDLATIDWTPSDMGIGGGEIDFLPAGLLALYQNDPTLISNFTVLNRIIPNDPSRAIALNGNIVSQIQDAMGGSTTGGSVWFYSPGGIIIGSNATLDIGSLYLTTSDPTNARNPIADGRLFLGGNDAVPGSSVEIRSGAAINALAEGSYVIAVAPVISQAGTVRVNGTAGYLAIERANITFDDGLISTSFTVGSDGVGGVSLRHSGTTTGPASGGTGDNHRIFLATMPKNDAVTMLIEAGSELGFDVAGAANVDGNAIVLSAGYELNSGSPNPFPYPADNADIVINDADFTSRLTAFNAGDFSITNMVATQYAGNVQIQARDDIDIQAIGTNATLNFRGNLDVRSQIGSVTPGDNLAAGDVTIRAANGGSINIAGNSDFRASAGGVSDGSGQAGDGTGGTILLQAVNGSTLAFDGTVNAEANGAGGSGMMAGNGQGGTINIEAIGGNSVISFASDATFTATGRGGNAFGDGNVGGNGQGGQVNMRLNGGAGNRITSATTLQFTSEGQGALAGLGGKSGDGRAGDLFVDIRDGGVVDAAQFGFLSRGLGARTDFSPGIGGSDVFGGNIALNVEGAGSQFNSNTYVIAADTFAFSTTDADAGNGTGGNISVDVRNGGTINLGDGSSGLRRISADGRGADANGTGFNAGAGIGGQIKFALNNGALNFTGQSNISAFGVGGSGDGAASGLGRGGLVELIASGSNSSVQTTDQLRFNAQGVGGTQQVPNGNPGPGNDGFGGTVRLSVENGAMLDLGEVALFATGSGGGAFGVGQTGGEGTGGVAEIIVDSATLAIAGDLDVDVSGFGASGNDAGGGNGTGGDILFEVRNGGIANLNAVELDASARGANVFNGDGVANGEGRGGNVLVRVVDSSSVLNAAGQFELNATGSGTTGGSQGGGNIDGSDSFGGSAILEVANGTVNLDDELRLSASGFAGSAIGSGQGGNGFGGVARIVVNNTGALNVESATVTARGSGGTANGIGGVAGNGQGGNAEVIVNSNGTIDISQVMRTDVNGNGGQGANGASSGDGTGGDTFFSVMNGTIVGNRIFAQADGFGGTAVGSQAVGGNGFGGNAEVLALAGSMIDLDGAFVQAIGRGGRGLNGVDDATGQDGSDGGDGTGGTARILVDAGSGIMMAGFASVDASGVGGAGGNGGTGTAGDGGRGGNGGNGIGGSGLIATTSMATTNMNDGILQLGRQISIRANGSGGNGGAGGSGSTVQGNGGDAGNGSGGMAQFVMRGGVAMMDDMNLDGLGRQGLGGAGATMGVDGTIEGNMGLIDIGANNGTGQGSTFDIGVLTFDARNGWDLGRTLDFVISGGSTMNVGQMNLDDRDRDSAADRFSIIVDNATLDFGSLRAELAGDIDIQLINGATMTVGSFGLLTNNGGGSISLDGDGTLTLPNSIFIESEQDFVSNLVLNTGSTVDVMTGGAAVFNNDVMGRTLRIAAGDLMLADGIIFGDANTQRIDLRSTNNTSTILGGDGTGTGFVLDDNELSLFKAQDIFFTVDNGGLEIRDINLQGFDAGTNANLTQADSEFAIAANGLIRVNGNVIFGNMADGNILSIEAATGSGVEIAADTGGIFLDGNSPGGILTLSGDFIHIAEVSLLDQLAADPNFSGRDDALSTGLTVTRPDGVIGARTMNLNIAERLLIQNSGTAFELSGFNVGEGLVTINNISAMGDNLDIVLYGRIENPDGTFVTNEDVRDALIDPPQPDGFLAGASINGCLLSAGACDPIAPPPPDPGPTPDPSPDPDPIEDNPPVIAPDIRDRVENESQDQQSDPAEEEMSEQAEEESVTSEEEQEAVEAATSRSPIVRPVTIVDTRPLDSDVVIDEAVTGGGNPGLIGNPIAGNDGRLQP